METKLSWSSKGRTDALAITWHKNMAVGAQGNTWRYRSTQGRKLHLLSSKSKTGSYSFTLPFKSKDKGTSKDILHYIWVYTCFKDNLNIHITIDNLKKNLYNNVKYICIAAAQV